tara:strand:+ start:1166 stop:2413 length:1248 start_codon:yes stop_codon:yes gene_type:complete
MNNKYTFIDLFAGCGGLSLGLEQAGFHPVYVNELNKDAMATYLENRKEYPLLHDKRFHSYDIYELTKKKKLEELIINLKKEFNLKKGDISLVVGGPPCQGYSGIGHRRNYFVEKEKIPSNFLYKEMIKVIKHLEPKGFIFENVRGLLNSKWTKDGQKGEIFNDIKKEFSKLKNYFFDYQLIQCKDYGVPQNRPRVILVGIRNDQKFKPIKNKIASGLIPDKTNDYPNPFELLADLIDKNYKDNFITTKYKNSPKTHIQKKLRTRKGKNSLLEKGDKLSEQEYSNHSNNIIKKFQYMIDHKGKIPSSMKTKKFAQRVLPKFWDSKGPNITATSLPDDYVHFSQPRSLTVREWARLQMFPDWYVFKGKRTTGGTRRAGNPLIGEWEREVPKYTQIGNAVPVELARRIGYNIIKILKK